MDINDGDSLVYVDSVALSNRTPAVCPPTRWRRRLLSYTVPGYLWMMRLCHTNSQDSGILQAIPVSSVTEGYWCTGRSFNTTRLARRGYRFDRDKENHVSRTCHPPLLGAGLQRSSSTFQDVIADLSDTRGTRAASSCGPTTAGGRRQRPSAAALAAPTRGAPATCRAAAVRRTDRCSSEPHPALPVQVLVKPSPDNPGLSGVVAIGISVDARRALRRGRLKPALVPGGWAGKCGSTASMTQFTYSAGGRLPSATPCRWKSPTAWSA